MTLLKRNQSPVFELSAPRHPALISGPHKSFNKLNLLLVRVQSLWSCAHYFWCFTSLHDTKGITSLMLHVATCFKETVLLFNANLSFVVDSILSQTDKYMSKVNTKQIRLICWMCSKLKVNTVCHRSGVFVADFDHNQHVNIVLLLLTLNKYLSAGCESQVIMFWKHKKRYICFVLKVASPLSFNNLSLRRIEKSYEPMTNVSSWSLICSITAISQRFNLFHFIKPKAYINHWNRETN